MRFSFARLVFTVILLFVVLLVRFIIIFTGKAEVNDFVELVFTDYIKKIYRHVHHFYQFSFF